MAQKKWKNFKKWLIRKLGGYPDLPVKMPDVKKEQVNLVTLKADEGYPWHFVEKFGITSEAMIKDTPVEVELCHKLAWELAPYVDWQMEDCVDGGVKITAKVRVAKGKGDGINICFKGFNDHIYGK